MKLQLLLACLLTGCLSGAAQSTLAIEPNDGRKQVTVRTDQVGYEEVMKASIRNVSDRRLRLRWDKVVEYQPYLWESQVCDKASSYPPEVTSNYDPIQGITVPIVLDPGESFDLFLTITPYQLSGQARIEIVFREIDRPEKPLGIAAFQLDLTNEEDQAKLTAAGNRLSVYPNPVHDRFFLTNSPAGLARVEVYNTLGRKVRTYDRPRPGDSFPAGDLPQGVYLLSLLDGEGKVIKTLRLLRRDFRP